MFCRLSIARMILVLKYTGATILLLSVVIEIGQLYPNNDCKLIPLFYSILMTQNKTRVNGGSITDKLIGIRIHMNLYLCWYYYFCSLSEKLAVRSANSRRTIFSQNLVRLCISAWDAAFPELTRLLWGLRKLCWSQRISHLKPRAVLPKRLDG